MQGRIFGKKRVGRGKKRNCTVSPLTRESGFIYNSYKYIEVLLCYPRKMASKLCGAIHWHSAQWLPQMLLRRLFPFSCLHVYCAKLWRRASCFCADVISILGQILRQNMLKNGALLIQCHKYRLYSHHYSTAQFQLQSGWCLLHPARLEIGLTVTHPWPLATSAKVCFSCRHCTKECVLSFSPSTGFAPSNVGWNSSINHNVVSLSLCFI